MTRQVILTRLQSALEPLDYAHAMYEGGAAAFRRVDEWSDIDLLIIADDDRVEDLFVTIEEALVSLSEIELHYRLPEPTWHGHSQAFYRLEGTSPFMPLDITVLKKSSPKRYREKEIHGDAVVHFNKNQILQEESLNSDRLTEQLKERICQMKVTFDLFQPFVLKELNRGNNVEGLQFYHGMTLRPLVELLRMNYVPARYNFHTRYLYYDLPEAVVQRLESLFFVTNADDLKQKHQEAGEWFRELLEKTDVNASIKQHV